MQEVPRGEKVPYLSLRQVGFYTKALNLIIAHISLKRHQTVLMGNGGIYCSTLSYHLVFAELALL